MAGSDSEETLTPIEEIKKEYLEKIVLVNVQHLLKQIINLIMNNPNHQNQKFSLNL